MEDVVTVPPESGVAAPARPVSRQEFRAFVAPHWTAMARFARRAIPDDAWEDLLQEALTTAWRKRRQYDPGKGTPGSWLLAIVADKIFKQRRRPRRVDTPIYDLGIATDRTAALDLHWALGQLAPRQRIAVTLRYYLDLSTEETAQVMNCSSGTVKSTLSVAKRQLKTLLGEDYEQ